MLGEQDREQKTLSSHSSFPSPSSPSSLWYPGSGSCPKDPGLFTQCHRELKQNLSL